MKQTVLAVRPRKAKSDCDRPSRAASRMVVVETGTDLVLAAQRAAHPVHVYTALKEPGPSKRGRS